MIETEFLNRLPAYPGRVILRPVDGQANTFDIERADAPLIAGTPMNKATFDSVVHSRLTGRYYMPTFSRVQASSQSGITVNPIPSSGWVVNEGVGISGGYRATTPDGNSDLPEVFDESTSSGISTLNKTTYFVAIELPVAITVKSVRTYVYTIDTGVTLTTLVQGSNDGEHWATLATISGNQSGNTEVTLTTTGEYKHYRLSVSASKAATLRIYTFAFASYDLKTYSATYEIPFGWPEVWTEGQRTMIQVPADANTGAVVSNTIAGIPCDTVLQSGRRYELRYTGAKFAAKEV